MKRPSLTNARVHVVVAAYCHQLVLHADVGDTCDVRPGATILAASPAPHPEISRFRPHHRQIRAEEIRKSPLRVSFM